MRRAPFTLVATLTLLAGTLTVAGAGTPGSPDRIQEAASQVRTADLSSQARRRARRAPTRILVYPAPNSFRPAFPGSNAVRQCTSWLEPEYRPSGTVVVPRMRCWWERG
jgi:hypothetical protein